MSINYTTSLQPGTYTFPIVVYTEADKDTDYQVDLSDQDIRTVLDFLLDVGEDMSMLYAFREYNQPLYDRISDGVETFLTEKKVIGPLDEYGIAFPIELAKEADRIRLEY